MSKLQLALLFLLLGGLFPVSAHGQVGSVFTNVSAAVGGASTAMPINATNSQAWNPASITDLPGSELDINTRVSFPEITLNASLPISEMPGGGGGIILAGEIESGNRVNTSPGFSIVKKLKKATGHSEWWASRHWGPGCYSPSRIILLQPTERSKYLET